MGIIQTAQKLSQTIRPNCMYCGRTVDTQQHSALFCTEQCEQGFGVTTNT